MHLRVLRVSVVNKVLEFFSMLASRNSRKWGIAPVGAAGKLLRFIRVLKVALGNLTFGAK
ncbi:MAG: hypothetical protein DMG08_12715 [Acidobacteria bacterium]|nr:MAG: hypothetical protein DMG08_12715 [Acidobacteriota bacterium]